MKLTKREKTLVNNALDLVFDVTLDLTDPQWEAIAENAPSDFAGARKQMRQGQGQKVTG